MRATPSSYIFLPLVHLLLFAVCGELESFDKSNIIEVGSIGIACLILFAVYVLDISVYFSIKGSAVAFNPTNGGDCCSSQSRVPGVWREIQSKLIVGIGQSLVQAEYPVGGVGVCPIGR